MSLLQDLFITTVNMSITASYAAIGVILVRLLLKKAPKVFSYILWTPVLFRLVCPFSFDSAFSFFNLLNLKAKQGSGVSGFVPQNIGLMRTPSIRSGIGGIDSAANASLPAAVPAASADPMQIGMAVFSLVWIFGVIALLIYSIVSYAKIKRKLQTATRVDGNVFETDAIGTAFVCGFIHPKIYVPANVGDAGLSYILEHERTHIRRKDYLIKPLVFLALILHWFNPLMWLCFALMSRDMEMSCDESVLHRLGEGAKGGYSNSLLSLSVKRKALLAANPLAFGESHVKTRIKNILNFTKPAFWVIMIAVVAVCAAAIAFAANPSEGGTISEEDKRKIAAVVTEYYLKADPANKGTLRIYNIKKYGSGYLVLTEKYRGEGESFSVLFLVNHDFNIVAKAPGDIPKSPCFSANVVKDQGKSIVYGNFKNKKWNPQTDLVVDVQIDFIKITFEDGTYIREQVSMDKGYIVVVDTLSNIRNIEVYNSKGELQSDLINESACSEFSFIKAENETVSRQEEESATYISEDYKISLKYPSYWELNPNYVERYEGKDGFFQVGAIDGENMSIDEITMYDAFHKLNPYGSDPKIINRTIDGQEARLILPSADQPEEMHNQAGLIVKYPEAVKIGGSAYHYFILWADEGHIEQIGNRLTFLKKQDDLKRDEQDVRALVEDFGKTLQKVSLSAPKDVVATSIRKNFSGYVTSELLQKWQADPQSAPGRMVSSPWPDRIDLMRMEIYYKNQYTVYGEVIEVTSTELVSGGAAAKRPVTIVVQKVNDRWLISGVTIGEYSRRGPVIYENTQYGFCFYLPETWKGYSIVEEQWKGTNSGELIETGPQLLIRHPDWTREAPRQDIPIMVFTLEQWNALQNGNFSVSAAPIDPSKLGSNSSYVFVLPARYNHAFQIGFEEVGEILKGNPLWPSEDINSAQ